MSWIQPHYDKILHVTVTFVLMVFCMKLTTFQYSITIVFILQLVKAWLNYRTNVDYSCSGDMVANACGYLLTGLHLVL